MSEIDLKEVRKQKIKEIKTGLILDAALEVLSQKGYYETRLEDIAEKAGFSKSALYRYYKDKDEIFFTIAVRESKKIIDRLYTGEYRLSNDNHIVENMRRLLTISITAWGEHFSFLLTLNSFQVISLMGALQKQTKLMKAEKEYIVCENKMSRLMIGLFENAKKKGEISSQLNSEVFFDFFQGIIFIKIKKWYQQKKMDDISVTIEEILAFFSAGLGIRLHKNE